MQMGRIQLQKPVLCGMCNLGIHAHVRTHIQSVLTSSLLKSNLVHITLYFEESLCITVTYYLEIRVTGSILN